MTQIPKTVLKRVGGAIAMLHEITQRLNESRALDARFGGAGRYESEAHANRASDISWSLTVLRKFEAEARARGIDPAPVYGGFGGVPDVSLSPAAQNYAARQVLNELLDWATSMRGFDSPVWIRTRELRDRLFPAEPRASVTSGAKATKN